MPYFHQIIAWLFLCVGDSRCGELLVQGIFVGRQLPVNYRLCTEYPVAKFVVRRISYAILHTEYKSPSGVADKS